jgi:nicotinamidase-related amidase
MNSALLVVDLQVRLVSAAEDGGDVIGRVAGLIERARTAATPIFFIQHESEDLAPGTAGWQIDPRLGCRDDDLVVPKKACDAFHRTGLGAALAERGIDHLVICGMMTQYCVDTTVRRAIVEGYPVTLVADGHTTIGTETLSAEQIRQHHNATLDDFGTEDCAVALAPAAEISFVADPRKS